MFEKLNERFLRGREVFGAMTPGKKIMVAGGLAAVLASFIVLLIIANTPDYQVMYSRLSQEDAGAIVDKLKEKKVPYRLSGGGSVIEVPKELMQETRLFLATEGLPAGGAVGMEMFDETKLGATDFVQRLNFQRALQGELERTIKKFPEIDQVRVHLNIPKESLFIEEAREPSASIVVKLKMGRELSRAQLAGIVHLVSSSVEGLKPESISVVDTSGGLLYSKEEGDGALLSESQVRRRRKLEQDLANRITTMLERLVGPDKALARVTADLNYQQISTSEEIYDPDRTAIRSEQRLSEKSQDGAGAAGGVPNATYELGTGQRQQGAGAGGGEQYEKTEDTTNYEITRINRTILVPAGEVKRLSVAVMVDGTYTEAVKDDKIERTYIPRPQAELAQFEDLVRNAVGYDEERGDSVVVSSVAFYLPEQKAPHWSDMPLDYARKYGKPVFSVLLIVLFFLFVVRPIMSRLMKATEPEEPAIETAALPEGEEEAALPEPERDKLEKGRLTQDQILALAQQNPERTINLIRSWIDER